MSELEKALGILSDAEEALSTLMREGLEEQRYDDVAAVAEVTQLLTDLIGSLPSRTLSWNARAATRRERVR